VPDVETLIAAASRLVDAARVHEAAGTPESADAVTAARLALQEVFAAAGWVPPRYRQEEMRRDRALLAHTVGSSELSSLSVDGPHISIDGQRAPLDGAAPTG
jgi:hypothetical protein